MEDKCYVCVGLAWDDNVKLLPIWEDIEEYHGGARPDYIGCKNCHTMHENTLKDVE